MDNALLVGLSRQVALQRELDVIANNLANINTNGFKGESVQFEEYLSSPARADSFPLADRRVSFVQDRATIPDFSQGPLAQTGNALDVAISGEGFFTMRDRGVVTRVRGDTILLAPPLIVSEEQVDTIVNVVAESIDSVMATQPSR